MVQCIHFSKLHSEDTSSFNSLSMNKKRGNQLQQRKINQTGEFGGNVTGLFGIHN